MKRTPESEKSWWKPALVGFVVVGGTAVLLIAFLTYASGVIGDVDLSGHGIAALTIGIVLTMLIGIGLMGLVFYSNRRGYDDRASRYEEKLHRLGVRDEC